MSLCFFSIEGPHKCHRKVREDGRMELKIIFPYLELPLKNIINLKTVIHANPFADLEPQLLYFEWHEQEK